MKKMILFGALILMAATGNAQVSRQDASFSGVGLFGPTIHGDNGVKANSTGALGLLMSYRFMLTPHSELELNYSFAQNNQKYCLGGGCTPGAAIIPGKTGYYSYRVHSRQQEFTGAYVFTWTFKRYNPFVEAGIGTLVYTPVLDYGTTILGTRGSKGITGLFGGGLAYELSPSYDIRVEYRALLAKTPDFGQTQPTRNLDTGRYQILSMPTIGIAYHF